MEYEKSCGAVIYRINKEKNPECLIIFNKKAGQKGHWGFAKGHVETGETEEETAKREIFEETGIKAEIENSFRYVSTYSPKENVTKDAVYFLSRVDDSKITLQESEVADFLWCDFETAKKTLTFDKEILNEFIIK